MAGVSGARTGLSRSIVGWIYNHARKHYHRVADWYDFDDLIQDGLMIAYKCQAYYGKPVAKRPGRVSRVRFGEIDAPHYMSLVQTAFRNHVNQLSRVKRAVDDDVTKIEDLSPGQRLRVMMEPDEPVTDFFVLIAQLPEHLQKAVMLYFTDDGARRLRRLRVRLRGPDQTLTEKIRTLVGFPEGSDFETELRAYLWEREHLK